MSALPFRRAALAFAAVLGMLLTSLAAAGPASADEGEPVGVDVSAYQGNVDWDAVAGAGIQFAFIKATEGTGYTNGYFAQQYEGSYYAGLIRGVYHFGLPNVSSGAEQANFLVDNGGGWSADDHTLPAALDIEWNPYGSACYDMDAGSLVAWIHDFADTYRARTGRDAIIYTAASWWNSCTGGSTDFVDANPLWIAHYGVDSPAMPYGWPVYTFWQYTSSGSVPGIGGGVDTNVFNGGRDRLLALANNTP